MFVCKILFLWALLAHPTSSFSDDVWLEPNAWEIHSPSSNICPVCDIPQGEKNSITNVYYKEMVAQLFNRNNLKINPRTGQLERKIILTLTAAQLKIIENSSDIRDLNSAVMSVITKAKELEEDLDLIKTRTQSTSIFVKFISSVKYLFELLYSLCFKTAKLIVGIYLYSSEIRFGIFISAALLAIVLVNKRYNKNLVIVIIGFVLMFGYICTYIECNRKLEAEHFIKFIRESEPSKPSFFSNLLDNIFKTSDRDKKIKEFEDNSKVKLAFCRPDHVAVMYFNEMFFNQLEIIVEKMVDSMTKIKNSLPFPLNYIGVIALPFLFVFLISLLFQHTFNPAVWYSILRVSASSNHTIRTEEISNGNSNQGDRLSGENLKILFEVLKTKAEVIEKPQNSAVEDVKDMPLPITAKLDESSSPEKINKNNFAVEDVKDTPLPITAKLDDSLSPEKINNNKSVVQLEDCLEGEQCKKDIFEGEESKKDI